VDADRHVATFNAAVSNGRWERFVELFADDATLEFIGPAVGPFHGRAEIADAYARMPPDDTVVRVGDPSVVGDETVIGYRWSATGKRGTMRIREADDGRIARLIVTFD